MNKVLGKRVDLALPHWRLPLPLDQKLKLFPFGALTKQVEGRLGQLLYINVDGNGLGDVDSLSPAYVKLVSQLQVGGIIPHFGISGSGVSFEKRSAEVAKFQQASRFPLLVGADNFEYMIPETHGRVVHLGMGFGGGFLMNTGGQVTEACLGNLTYIDGFLERSMGVNLALGPTIDKSSRWGFAGSSADVVYPWAKDILDSLRQTNILNTIKHFPYTPDDYSLHKQTVDEKLSPQDVQNRIEIFTRLMPAADLVMTTHIFNSEIDSRDVVTFSRKWISILRNNLKFKGLIMTDGLFMFDHYPENIQNMSARWNEKSDVSSRISIFAARAILAGHDLIFLEGDAAQTRKVFKDLHYIACQNTRTGELLRDRIDDSFERILTFKKAHLGVLFPRKGARPDLVNEAAHAFSSTVEYSGLVRWEDKSTWPLPFQRACSANGDFVTLRRQIEK